VPSHDAEEPTIDWAVCIRIVAFDVPAAAVPARIAAAHWRVRRSIFLVERADRRVKRVARDA
jgi:hypothetical protein